MSGPAGRHAGDGHGTPGGKGYSPLPGLRMERTFNVSTSVWWGLPAFHPHGAPRRRGQRMWPGRPRPGRGAVFPGSMQIACLFVAAVSLPLAGAPAPFVAGRGRRGGGRPAGSGHPPAMSGNPTGCRKSLHGRGVGCGRIRPRGVRRTPRRRAGYRRRDGPRASGRRAMSTVPAGRGGGCREGGRRPGGARRLCAARECR